MSDADITYFASQALILTLWLSLPVIIVATAVGLLVGLFQALTQIQEQTLPFAIKLAGVIVTIIFTSRWMGSELHHFTLEMFDRIPLVGN